MVNKSALDSRSCMILLHTAACMHDLHDSPDLSRPAAASDTETVRPILPRFADALQVPRFAAAGPFPRDLKSALDLFNMQ